ncbi:aldehyde dehydrogenase family protein [Ancylobacter dichloromethanicus]|uniref:aldehyde dehydrogenase (NAD(+)) n=1 Tax=Ancylobacter dichloromethanicus TaxID=518825 RepID=A0A9W6J7S6_9HYPH|nr:aldehyde dehydrogenase family protein [Ancylobacter dichloromethanicus]MBS7555850.1 aldehyde dehydrogenase family protein [Ancylobacter dichloromethanicus]GLK72391.1 aldehyde dehydrogenase [Ancylobacter dichloromethanicus]
MRIIDTAYIAGDFVPIQGGERLDVVDPATEAVIAKVRLANREDAQRAIDAAWRAQPEIGRSSKAERIGMLRRLEAELAARAGDIAEATIAEYGAPAARVGFVTQYASQVFGSMARTLADYTFTRSIGDARVRLEPVGVSALIAPWNSVAGTICSKLASALAAGCASVIKPSEFSPLQTQAVTEALHAAGLPAGVVNVVTGRGTDVGDELAVNPRIARISFTGSTATGKIIARAAVDGMKRVSLSLSGKSASIILDDADLATAVPLALNGGFNNNGQACIAGTRILVPRNRLGEVVELVRSTLAGLHVGDPRAPSTIIGPVASPAQYDRIQRYIARGLEQGARLVAGGEGRPEGLEKGYFVRPTVFADVSNDMDIAREEIFGPVLSILAYDTEEEAIEIANDSAYGLYAYVFSGQRQRALRVADRLHAGTVLINTLRPELLAPFGGVKQSGIGRELGIFGLESFLEPKTEVAA